MNVKRGHTTAEIVNYNVPTFKSLLRNLIYGSKERLYDSDNTIIRTIVTSLHYLVDVFRIGLYSPFIDLLFHYVIIIFSITLCVTILGGRYQRYQGFLS